MPEWRWVPESGQLVLETASRDLTIRWDDGDRGWFLAVTRRGRQPMMGRPGVEPMSWVCPLPLLCALVLVPREFHGLLTGRVKQELGKARGEALAAAGLAVGQLPRPFPGPSKAATHLADAISAAHEAERLSLDWAAAGAMEG
jgi:hypothetical protein